MRYALSIALLAVAGLLTPAAARSDAPAAPVQPADAPTVVVVRIDGQAIGPITERFIIRGIEEAERLGSACLVIELDTPGGLMDSTHVIVRSIVDSRVPVAVYVAPTGARAASAGVFITYAAHVAAMAPATHIGAAHPVSVGGLGSSPPPDPGDGDGDGGEGEKSEPRPPSQRDVMGEKAVNDAVAWVRSLAELRGRNADWAESAVTQSKSITATQALELKVVDLLADDLGDLLAAIDGRDVALGTSGGGARVTLATAGARLITLEMWWGEKLLAVISSPNVAFLLLMFGFYGVLFEFYTPGWGVGGTLGAILLLLGFFGLAYLPINYAGLGLIALAMGLFVAEAFVTSFGALTLGGVVCLTLGGLMLVDSPAGFTRVSATVVVPVALATAAVTVFLATQVVRSMRAKAQTGGEGMVGADALAVKDFTPDAAGGCRGLVAARGERWSARSASAVAAGQRVRILSRDGLTLHVEPIQSPNP